MTEPIEYNESELIEELSVLNPTQRVAFAAACAQRWAPVFRRYAETEGPDAGPPDVLEAALDALWQVLQGAPVEAARLSELAESTEAAVPEEDNWNEWADLSEHAAVATSYAIRAWLRGQPQDAVVAAEQGYHAADFAASNELNPSVISQEAAQAIDASEHVQQELRRQREDLATVRAWDGSAGAVTALRDRAASQGRRMFDQSGE